MPHSNTPLVNLALIEARRLWPFVTGFAVMGGLIYKANASLTRTLGGTHSARARAMRGR